MKNLTVLENYNSILDSDKYYPSLSIITSIHFTINPHRELEIHLKDLMRKCNQILINKCTDEMAQIIKMKLNELLNNIDHKQIKNSIAIFISPLFSKIFYIDLELDERIVVDNSFEIRDLIFSTKNLNKYLLILLSGKNALIYLGNTHSLLRIKKINANDIGIMHPDLPDKVANFTDSSKIKETLLDKFLLYIDKQLNSILQKYPLPIFIMGASKTNGHFANITHHNKSIIEFIHGNYEEKSELELLTLIAPHVNMWKRSKNESTLINIDDAISHKKASIGINAVWKCATERNGRQLFVEKNFVYAARNGALENEIFDKNAIIHNNLYIYDAVDDIIEKVISAGGSVEFVDEGLLSKYNRIVLIQYY